MALVVACGDKTRGDQRLEATMSSTAGIQPGSNKALRSERFLREDGTVSDATPVGRLKCRLGTPYHGGPEDSYGSRG